MSMGENIQYVRKYYGWTQKDLAEKIGKAESSIRKYESDSINIPLSVVDDLSEVFNINRKDLIGDLDNLRHILAVKDFKDNMDDDCNQSNSLYDILNKAIVNYINLNGKQPTNPILNEISINDLDYEKYINNSIISERNIPYKTTPKNWMEEPTEFNQKVIYDALYTLVTYANKCTNPYLTENQFDIIFDKTIDYIKYQLYQISRE